MILKFVFKNEIHRCSKVPADFQSLLVALKQIFKEALPEYFTLQYDDADGDKIMLTSNDDYKTMLESDMSNSQASVKIFVTPSEKSTSIGNLTVKLEDSKPSQTEVKSHPKEEIKEEPKRVEEKKPVVEEKKPVVEEKIQVVEKKDPFNQALVEAEEAVKKFNVEPELEAKVHALVLKTFKSQLELVAGAVRENIIKSQESVKPTTPAALIETLVYVQKLAQGVEGASNEQIQGINVALKQAIEHFKTIQESKPQEKKPHEEPKKEPEPVEKKPVEQKPIESKPVEIKPVDPTEALNGEFIKEISQLPLELTEKDINLYKTIVIKNNGKETYPAKTFIQCVSSKDNARISVSQIQPGKEFTTVLIINSPVKPGKYSSTWAFMCERPDGTVHEFGKRFDVHFEIIGENKPEPKPEPKGPVYSKEIKEKAVQIKEVFPQYNIDDICEYISKSPQKTLDELFNEYMSLHNSISGGN